MERFAVLASLGLISLAACAVGPDFKRPEIAAAANWNATDPRLAAQTAADALWWKTFNDPTLDRLVDLGYRQNLSLQIAGLRIVEARAQYGVATGRLFPQTQALNANVTAIGLTAPLADIIGINRNLLSFQAGFDAAWELDFWGKYRRGVESESAVLLGSMADYQAALVALTAEIAKTYVGIRTSELLIRQAEDNAKVQEESLAIAQARFKNGATSELDPSQATTLLESTRATIPQLRAVLQQQRNALATLL
ncbi:MAG TPA: TolC family protein, partial [Polyangia bacterium]